MDIATCKDVDYLTKYLQKTDLTGDEKSKAEKRLKELKSASKPTQQRTAPGRGAAKSGARGAMNAFKAMDKAEHPEAAASKPNFLSAPRGGGRGGVQRNPSAIKQMILDWCAAMTRDYEGVDVKNFGSSWADGLAFCALIHRFHPEGFDFSTLKKENRRENFTLAFDTAEKLADITPLLEVDDMVKMKVPDWKCVFTYIQFFYKKFRSHPESMARCKPAESPSSPNPPTSNE